MNTRKQKLMNTFMKKLRTSEKLIENAVKPNLYSHDVVYTSDFIFSPTKPLDRVGDSGPLLFAKRKHNRSEQYLVKHAYCDSASNEYVYSKLAHPYRCFDVSVS